MSAIQRVVNHVRETVARPPTGTVARFDHLRRDRFRDAATTPAARLPLELMVGQDRVFEVSPESGEHRIIEMGQAVPTAAAATMPVRVRYDAQTPSRTLDILTQIRNDQTAIVDALHRSQWSSVAGLVHLSADVGEVITVTDTDDQGREFSAHIAEIIVSVSYDI